MYENVIKTVKAYEFFLNITCSSYITKSAWEIINFIQSKPNKRDNSELYLEGKFLTNTISIAKTFNTFLTSCII